ncbi:MAG: helix-turn-helix transcriptional regulator [Acidimicrobiales bacterium]
MEVEPLLTTSEWEQRIGDEVRSLRQRQRLTQAELARRANISLSAVKYLEKGRGSSLATLVRIARVFKRTEWLASFAPPEPVVSPLAVLREHQRLAKVGARRVRHATSSKRSS